MYNKVLEQKIDQMFQQINEKISAIIESTTSKTVACDQIATFVGSETASRSKTMLNDMCTTLSQQFLDSITDIAQQNRFYEANLRHEILEKYNFSVPSKNIDYIEANRELASIAAGAGTAIIGGLLIYALTPAAPAIPIAIVAAASISVFCVSYFKITPDLDKAGFKTAIDKYLSEVKTSYISWFNETERYFNKRADDIRRSF